MDELANLNSLRRDLTSRDRERRRGALNVLQKAAIPASRPFAIQLCECTADSDRVVREHAVAILEGLGSPPLPDAGDLTRLLDHEHQDVAYWAATLLGRLGQQGGQPVARALGKALTSRGELAVRERAAWALGRMGPAATPALNALRDAAAEGGRLAHLAGQALETHAAFLTILDPA